MTAQQPAPEAVEALVSATRGVVYDPDLGHRRLPNGRERAERALTFLRDAIHGDGPESDAIRDALGLWVEEAYDDNDGLHSRCVRGIWQEVER